MCTKLLFVASLMFCWFISFSVVLAQDELFQSMVCARRENCESCLRAGEFCHWCDDSFFNSGRLPSCNTKEVLEKNGCPPSSTLGNKPSSQKILENKPLSDFNTDEAYNANQIRPQKVSVAMKPGDTQTISFEYRLAKNYPLDLYYLMDLTWSMRDDKETLVGLEIDLPVALGRLTDNFKLGFGSFADKPLMPYTSMTPKHRENPCSIEDSVCEPTYTFRHRLSFTDQVNVFVSTINSTSITGNLDNMEATLEALMQVLVCGDRIGWSEKSRKIVILATDGQIHFAGMGKLGGVVKRNDEKCHLDENGNYTESTSQDYPSLGQIDRILEEKKINVIFAVTEEVKRHYDRINELLPDTTYIGKLEADSSNVLNLVKQGYEDFSSVFSFEDNSEDIFELKYFSDCGTGTVVETSKCESANIGETYKFTVNITMNDCTAKDHGKKRIIISESQIGTDVLTIELDLHCKCECQSKSSIPCPPNSSPDCGKCICLEGWMGPDCECNILNADNASEEMQSSCVFSYEPDGRKGIVCSGAGDCFCGACFCDPGFSGAFCECKDCERDPKTGLTCGGPSRGVCSCGQCICRDGYEGPSCDCPTAEKSCTLPGDAKPCSGRGICRCGECICSREGTDKFAGKFCDICTNCENPACQLYEDCARSAISGGPSNSQCVSSKGTLFVPTIINNPLDSYDNISLCFFDIEEEGKTCKYPFTYHVAKDWTVDIKIYPRSCWGLVDTALLALPVFIATILLGLLFIVLCKCYIHVSDKRAYAKFAAERDKQLELINSAEENPLYKSPITHFAMPEGFRTTDRPL